MDNNTTAGVDDTIKTASILKDEEKEKEADETLDIEVDDKAKPHFERCYAAVIKALKKEGKDDKIGDEFKELKTDEARFEFVNSMESVHECISLELEENKKSCETALKRRETGNNVFKKTYYADAYELYTQSIQLFPKDLNNEMRTELAKSYANRATTACHMNEYHACLTDIERAFDLDYPDDLKFKLYEKQGKCYRYLKNFEKATESLKNGITCLTVSDLPKEKKANMLTDMKKQLVICERLAKETTAQPITVPKADVPEVSKGPSTRFPAASKVFNVIYDDVYGRHGVATKDISVGDVVVVEKPYASVVLPPYYNTHCYHCFQRVKSSVPCDHCIRVRFCDDKCKSEAWEEYHRLECCVLDYIDSTDHCWGHLAHRLIVKLGFDNLVKFRDYLLNEGDKVDWKKYGAQEETISSTDYKAVHALVTHAEDRTPADLFFRTVKAVYLVKCLRSGGFFPDDVSDDIVRFTGGLILSNLQLCPCNAHEVGELQVFKSDLQKTKSLEIGAGLYPTLSLLNHSCDPNVVRHFYGDVCVTRAIHHIAKGEQIVDNYGVLYPTSKLPERLEHLRKQYYFVCQCKACKQDWPMYPEMLDGDDSPPVLKCEKCGDALMPTDETALNEFPCGSCGHKHDVLQRMGVLDESHDKFARSLEAVMKGDNLSVGVLQEHLDLMDRLLYLPWKMFNNAQEALKHNYAVSANCFMLP